MTTKDNCCFVWATEIKNSLCTKGSKYEVSRRHRFGKKLGLPSEMIEHCAGEDLVVETISIGDMQAAIAKHMTGTATEDNIQSMSASAASLIAEVVVNDSLTNIAYLSEEESKCKDACTLSCGEQVGLPSVVIEHCAGEHLVVEKIGMGDMQVAIAKQTTGTAEADHNQSASSSAVSLVAEELVTESLTNALFEKV